MRIYLLFAVITVTLSAATAGDGDAFDGIDVKKVLSDRKTLLRAYNCLMDRGPCGEFRKLRENAPRILKSRCADCTPTQKAKFDELNARLRRARGSTYRDLIEKYA